jgi:hypothetical protein
MAPSLVIATYRAELHGPPSFGPDGAPRRSGYLNMDLLKEHEKEQMRQLDQAA